MEALFVNLIQTQDQMLDMAAKGGLCTGAWQSFRGANLWAGPGCSPRRQSTAGGQASPARLINEGLHFCGHFGAFKLQFSRY